MGDILGSRNTFGGSFSSDQIAMSFSGLTGSQSSLIIQAVDIQYSQTITRLFALESQKIYFVRGQTNAQSQLTGIVGPAGLATKFLEQYSNVCKLGDVALSTTGPCFEKAGDNAAQSAGKVSLTLKNFVITGVNFKMQVSDYLLYNGMSATFISLDTGLGVSTLAA